MPKDPKIVVVELNFEKFATDVHGSVPRDKNRHSWDRNIQDLIIQRAPKWVTDHVRDKQKCDVIHLRIIGPASLVYWCEEVRVAIEKRLKLAPYFNTAGNRVGLRTNKD